MRLARLGSALGEALLKRVQALETVAPLDLPSWTGTVRLSGVRAFDRVWDVRLEGGTVGVEGV